jgi:hypothetical protein
VHDRRAVTSALPCGVVCVLQCNAFDPVFTGKIWTARVSLAVYVMAIQSVMGECHCRSL